MIIHRPVSPSPIRQSTEEAVRNGMIYLLSTIWSYLSTASRSSSASPLPIQLFAERVIFFTETQRPLQHALHLRMYTTSISIPHATGATDKMGVRGVG